jgi:hypothetical protein
MKSLLTEEALLQKVWKPLWQCDAQGEMRDTGVKNGRKERNVAKKLKQF